MAAIIKRRKPTSPGARGTVLVVDPELHKGKPHKALMTNKTKTCGRNNQGRLTVRHKGGGHRRHLRAIDFTRLKDNVIGKVERFEYDPNRSAHLALVLYADGERRYIIRPLGLKVGDKVVSGHHAPIEVGNCMPLEHIPVGTTVHCVELRPGKGAQIARSAGCSVQIVAREGDYVTLRLKKETRKVLAKCRATIGVVGNEKHNLEKSGKAGRSRHLGIRPTVRGVAMNPIDHPHGGGEGRTSGGRPSCSPTGLLEGKKTRNNKRTDKYIVDRKKR